MTMTAPSTLTLTGEQRKTILNQIGKGNFLSISGGRVQPIADGIEMPVSNGYWVRVQLTAADDYTVSRIFRRAGKEIIKGQATGIYCDDIGNAAYYCSCFRSYDAEEWVTK